MTATRRYIVVRGAKSACGLHPSVSWRPCKACERAAAATESALANVKPVPNVSGYANQHRMTSTEVAVCRDMRARGAFYREIAAATGFSESAVESLLRGDTHRLPAGEGQRASSAKLHAHFETSVQKTRRQAIPHHLGPDPR